MRVRADLALAFGALLFLAGLFAGRGATPVAAPTPPPPPAPRRAEPHVHVEPPSPPARAPAFDPRLSAIALADLLTERRKAGDENLGRAAAIDGELRRRMVSDPDVLEDLLSRFKTAPDPAFHPSFSRVAENSS